MHILLILPPKLALTLGEYLEQRGHVVLYAATVHLGLHQALIREFDAIVLAARLPGMSGSQACGLLRKAWRLRTPLVMIGEEGEEHVAPLLEAGADLYVAQPFAFGELDERLSALLRRDRHVTLVLTAADLEFDLETLEVRRQGQPVALRPTELPLLRVLMEAAPQPVGYSDLKACLWGEQATHVSDAKLRSRIQALRRKIDKPFGTRLIRSHRNVGYAIAAPETRRAAARPQ